LAAADLLAGSLAMKLGEVERWFFAVYLGPNRNKCAPWKQEPLPRPGVVGVGGDGYDLCSELEQVWRQAWGRLWILANVSEPAFTQFMRKITNTPSFGLGASSTAICCCHNDLTGNVSRYEVDPAARKL